MHKKIILGITCLIIQYSVHAQDNFLINMDNCKENTRNAAALLRVKSLCGVDFPPDVKNIVKERDFQCEKKYVYIDPLFKKIISDENKNLNDLYLKHGETQFCSIIPTFIEQIRHSTSEVNNETVQ